MKNLTMKKWMLLSGAMLLMGLPLIGGDQKDWWIRLITSTCIWGMLGLGLNVIIGFSGMLVLGFSAYVAIGAYTTAWLNVHWLWPWWASLVTAAGVTAGMGWISAAPAMRLRGDYLAIVTLGFGEIMVLVAKNWDEVTNGPRGISLAHPHIGTWDYKTFSYYATLIMLGTLAIALTRLHRSRVGRALVAIREDELAASAMGISPTALKFTAFTLGSGIAGWAGAWYAHVEGFISPESFSFTQSVWALCIVVLGGLGSVTGTILGAVLLTLIPEVFRDLLVGFEDYRVLVVGIALVLMMIFRPQGLLPEQRSQYHWPDPTP